MVVYWKPAIEIKDVDCVETWAKNNIILALGISQSTTSLTFQGYCNFLNIFVYGMQGN